MSTDSMPILPETDPASDRWAPQDSNGGKCLQDMSSEVMFESIRISKCLLNESSDSRCGEKPALKMKIVLAEKKEKSELSSNSNRAHEDDEDTDLLEDESDSSAELTIVDDAKADEPPPEQGQEKKKLPKEARKKRKAKEVQAPKSVTMKKRREDREAEKRRVEELFKTQENEAIAKRIAMEFSNFRRFRVSSSDEPSPRVESNPPSDSRDSRSGASPKPTVPESSLRVDLAQPKSSVEKPGYPPRSKELAVDIPSSENLNSISRNGSADSSSQCHASRFEKSMQESKDGFPLPPLPSQGKHHIPIGPPPAPSTLISALSVSHQSAGGVERESPRQSPRRSPEGSLVRLDHMNSEVSIDRTNSSEPSPTIVRTTSVCPGSAPNTIHIPIPLCRIEQLPPKCPSASEQSQRSPQVHGNKQFELSIATRTSPPRLYATLAPLCVEVPLPSGLTTTSNGSQVPATSHSRLRAQNLYGSTTCDSETKQSAERQAELRTSVAPEATKTGGQVFNPKFSAFSVDNLTKIDVRTRETTRSSPSDLIKESQRPNPANSESTLPTGPPQKQSAARAGDPDTSSGKVCVVRQSEFEFARPHVPRKPRSKASSPTPQSSPIHPGCSGSAPTNANGHNPESKSALIWRYIQDQSGGSTMQTIDSALESVRSSSNRLKQDDSYTILANYLQGQRNGDAPDETAREDRTLPDQPMSPNLSADSLDARSLYLTKLKKMLVTLQKFSTTISMDVGKAVYHNIYALASGGANVDEFIAKTQRATKLALKPYVGPFLTAYLPLLQREITVKAAGVRMSSSRFMRSNPDCLIDPAVDAGDPHEVFVSEFDIPNKKKALPSEPSTVDAQVPAQNATLDHLANATVSLEMQDIESRYQTHLTIQNDLMLIQEMLDRISKMVESTKKALSTLQAESSSPMCREMSTKPSPRCSPIVPPHASSPTTTSFAKDLPTSVARLDHLLKSPPRYNSNAQNFSAFNTQQRKPSYAENPLWLPRPASNDVPRAGAFNSLNQTQKDSMACLEMRIPQVMPPVASPTFAMRPSGVPSPTATQKETPPNSNLNPPMPEAVMGYVPQDVLVSGNTDALRKDSAASNSRESFSSSSSSPIPSFLTSAAADKKYQESLRRKSLPTVTSKTPINPSSPQTSISQPTEISDAECCWNCGRSAQETCSGCKLAKYCGLFCQHRDWEVHHRVCRVIGSNSPKSPPSK